MEPSKLALHAGVPSVPRTAPLAFVRLSGLRRFSLTRAAWLGIALSGMVSGQEIVTVPDFHPPLGGNTLRCQITPVQPVVTFEMRIRTGYSVTVPVNQARGPGHSWRIVVRITPDGGEPVYLASDSTLSPPPKNAGSGYLFGQFQVGDGHYSAALALTDDLGRACSREWQFEASFDRLAPGFSNPILPGDVKGRSWTPPTPHPPVFRRLTVIVDGLDENWRNELTLLLEQAPARSVRLAIYGLPDQYLFRDDDFRLSDLGRVQSESVKEALKALAAEKAADPHGKLHRWKPNPASDAGLLASLVTAELRAPDPSETVIILGSEFSQYMASRAARDVFSALTAAHAGVSQRYFYIRYFVQSAAASQRWESCGIAGRAPTGSA